MSRDTKVDPPLAETPSIPNLDRKPVSRWPGSKGTVDLKEQALAQLRESILITDAQLDAPGPHIVYVNDAFTRMTGWQAEEVIGKNPRFLQGPKTTRKTMDRLRLNLENGERFTGEDINYRKDGSEFYIDWYIEPMRNVHGEITHFVAVQRDVSEQRALEKNLLVAQRLESIGLLASGIAHDLNNVFAPILIVPQILRQQVDDSGQEELLALMESSARRGIDLVKQVLVFARGTTETAGFVLPRHVVEELAKVIKSTFSKAISLVTDVPFDISPIEMDATQLYQLLLNLCINARDAIAETGTITVRGRNFEAKTALQLTRAELLRGEYVVLSVSDTGSGISEANLENIFQPFFTTKDPGHGTGLGLATVSVVVKNSRGVIDIETALGRGTTFSVYLPAAQPRDEAVATPLSHPSQANPRRILLVDDEAAIVMLLREVLQSAGHTVATARNGLEAQAALAQGHFDLALVDLMMPGEAIGSAIREMRRPGMTLIAISGLSKEEAQAEAPAVSVLQKPFTPAALLAAVNEAVATPLASA